MEDQDQDAADVALAIEALGSLRSAPSEQHSGKRPPSSISLPPISSMMNGVAHGARGPYTLPQQQHQHHLQGSSSSSATSAASTSGLTFSPATTPSANTSNSTAGSELSSPSSAHFFHDGPGSSAVAGCTSSAVSRASDRPPYSSVFVRNGERRPGIDTPGDTCSIISSASVDGLADLSTSSHNSASSPIGSQQGDDGFIGRVSQFPIVSGALKVYERGRNSNRVVKYGANLVESSVKTISKPVINRVVGPNLAGQLDDFACRQLDRFGSRSASGPRLTPRDRTTPTNSSDHDQITPAASTSAVEASYFPPTEAYYRRPHGKGRAADTDSIAEEESVMSPGSDSTTSASLTRRFSSNMPPASQQQIVRTSSAGRSRWQNLVIEAGVTAGGIGAAVSEESMKSLKYCLHWLHYATAHLDHQIRILREFILSLTSASQRALALDAGHHHVSSGALLTQEDARAADILDGIKRDVIDTIRKVVNVVSTYAGAALPEQARRYVRSSILSIPERWTRAIQGQELQQGMDGMAIEASPEHGPATSSPVLSATHAAAERTLTFAVDTLDMLRGVLNIFNDSVDRADAWVERLRIVGLQRHQASSNGHTISGPPQEPRSPDLPRGPLPITTGMKRREDDSEIDDDADMLQRRKNSRTSLVRGTAKYVGTTDMQIDA